MENRETLHRLIHHKAEAAEDGVNRCRSDDVALCNTLRLADTSDLDPERDVHRVEGGKECENYKKGRVLVYSYSRLDALMSGQISEIFDYGHLPQ